MLAVTIASVIAALAILSLAVIPLTFANTDPVEENHAPAPRDIPPDIDALIGRTDPTPPDVTEPIEGYTIKRLNTSSPEAFLESGGRAAIVIRTHSVEPITHVEGAGGRVEGARGEIVSVPVTITHMAGANPFDSITIYGGGVSNGFIPAAVAKQSTEAQRVEELRETGTISDSLDLNSTVSFSPSEITLAPGEARNATIFISIPSDWPDYMIGTDVWYSIYYVTAEKFSTGEGTINQIPVYVSVVG